MGYHLLRCFSDADASLSGRITAVEFDGLIDIAAAAPRNFGFAPQASEMFKSVDERKKARKALFKAINADGSGEISFQEFLEWAVTHILQKVSGEVKTYVPPAPAAGKGRSASFSCLAWCGRGR